MSQALALKLDKSFGAAFCGLLVTTLLYGITSFQTYTYLRTFLKDGPRLKAVVWSLWILDTAHVACVSHSVYWYLITNYSNSPALDDCIWSLSVSLGLNVIIAFIVQCFFAKRVWYLGRSRIFTAVVAVFVLAHVAFGMITMIEFLMKDKLSQLSEIKLFPVTPFAIAAVGSDIVIATALCYYLHNVRTGIARTESLIDTLMIYAVERCLLTSFFAISEIVCFSAFPNTLIYLAIDFFMGKLYANSLLATLNARMSLRGRGNDEDVQSSYARRTGSKTGREAHQVSIEFAAGLSNTGVDPSSFGVESTPNVVLTSVKNESRTQVVDIV